MPLGTSLGIPEPAFAHQYHGGQGVTATPSQGRPVITTWHTGCRGYSLNTSVPLWAEKGRGNRTGRGIRILTRPTILHYPAICPLTPLGLARGCADLSPARASSPQPLQPVASGYLLVMVVARGAGDPQLSPKPMTKPRPDLEQPGVFSEGSR